MFFSYKTVAIIRWQEDIQNPSCSELFKQFKNVLTKSREKYRTATLINNDFPLTKNVCQKIYNYIYTAYYINKLTYIKDLFWIYYKKKKMCLIEFFFSLPSSIPQSFFNYSTNSNNILYAVISNWGNLYYNTQKFKEK